MRKSSLETALALHGNEILTARVPLLTDRSIVGNSWI